MSRPGFYRILENPLVYSLAVFVFAPGGRLLFRKHYEAALKGPSDVVLDVGCGPKRLTPAPQGRIVGIDINLDYVNQYSASSECDQLGAVSSALALPFPNDTFSQTRCTAVIHHFDDDTARQVISEMYRVTKPGGWVIIFDQVFPKYPILRPLAWMTCKLDRGEWVRTEQEELQLLNSACEGEWQNRRFTYTFSGLEGVIYKLEK